MNNDKEINTPTSASFQIAGFWRRLGALLLDSLVLGVFGQGLGLMFSENFARMGIWGRALGFLIALAYLGIMNSRLCGGQSFGKRALKLRVLALDGTTLTPIRSFARAAVLCIPFFSNGAPYRVDVLLSWMAYPLSLIVLGVGLSIVYLFIFNRKTRQSLHDLIVKSVVVVTGDAQGKPLVGAVWGGHYLVTTMILVLAGLAPALSGRFLQSEPFAALLPVQQALANQPGITSASLMDGTSWVKSAGGESRHQKNITVRVTTAALDADRDSLADHLADLVLAKCPGATTQDVIYVSIAHGYDIGIASAWVDQRYAFSPAQWRQRIDARARIGSSSDRNSIGPLPFASLI